MPPTDRYLPAPRFDALADGFWDVVEPAPFPRHVQRFRNERWAERVGLGALTDAEWERHFARFEPLPANLARPLALRYHGHQFHAYNPYLGDGRGFLYAQFRDPVDGRLLDLGTKGSGRTPWSRGGDGRLTLKGGVREVLATEMLEALGVYTSKTWSLFETGEALERHDEPSPTRASVLVRLSHGHVRFGSFQRHAHARDAVRLGRLLDFAVEHYVPGVGEGGTPVAFLRDVAQRTAELCASWMAAGFVHGVLNTDNMNVTGESFDYGPYRFLPTYDPHFTAAYFDHSGLYAFGRQPAICRWNLERLAEALSLVAPLEELAAALAVYEPTFARAFTHRVLDRLGLVPRSETEDAALVEAVYAFLDRADVGYDQFFFDWMGGEASRHHAAASPAAAAYAGPAFEELRRRLAPYLPAVPARLEDPYFQRDRPCSMLIDEIEAIWDAIAERDDWAPFAAKIAEVRDMGRALGQAR